MLWFGTEDKSINSDVFWKIADILYDNGFGGTEVNESLLVVGDKWWMERHEYDGSEWWEYKEHPTQPIIETDDARKLIFPYPCHIYESEVYK